MAYIINSEAEVVGLLKLILPNTEYPKYAVLNDSGAWLCVSLTAATPTALQILVESYFVNNPCTLVNISYSENATSTQHTAYITINPTI
jgi:hypothetical protein